MIEDGNFRLTPDQERVFNSLLSFIEDDNKRVFILCGYAGTGKTTMMKALISELGKREMPYSLHASTGRAAKILSNVSGVPATTVHSLLYRFSDFNHDLEEFEKEKIEKEASGQLLLQFEAVKAKRDNIDKYKFYIIDEASMVSDLEDKNPTQALFGSGKLLRDLLQFDENGKFIFIGDVAQLPPIKSNFSPALSSKYFFEHYCEQCFFEELTQIVRQSGDNDIIRVANKVRHLFSNPPQIKWAKFPMRNCQNIRLINSQVGLINRYVDDIKTHGFNHCTMIARSNNLCNQITKTIRPALGINSLSLSVGDLLMVTQNNMLSGLMNGDMVKVTQVGNRTKQAGLTFIQVEVEELFSSKRYSQLIIEDILYGQQTNLLQEQQQQLFMNYFYRMRDKGIKQKSKLFRDGMYTDEHLNALRAVFGYVITCHKAQGGEWENVYLDIPRNLSFNPTSETYQWLYTAITRTRTNLYIVDDFYIS